MMPSDAELAEVLQKNELQVAIGLSNRAWWYCVACAVTQDRPVSYVIKRIVEDFADREFRVAEEVVRFQQEEPAQQKPKRKSISNRTAFSIFDRDDGVCHYCKTELPRNGDWHIDHKIPVIKGGSNEEENLVLSCARCNIKKGDMNYQDFIAGLMR